MTDFTHLSDVKVQGKVESSTQGGMIGSFTTLPPASALNSGCIALYTGAAGEYIPGRFYRSNGSSWTAADNINPPVDGELSETSTNPLQNKVLKTYLDDKMPRMDYEYSPAENSMKLVQSGGVFEKLRTKAENSRVESLSSDLTALQEQVNGLDIPEGVVVDREITSSGTNPVQGKAIYDALGGKVDKVEGLGLSTNDYSDSDKDKLAGIDEMAQVNAIETIKVDGTTQTPVNKVVDIDLRTRLEPYALKSELSAVYRAKDSVESTDKLPLTGNTVGDVRNVESDGMNYVWTADGHWDALGGSFDGSGYATKTELTTGLSGKQDSITPGTGLRFDGLILNHSNAISDGSVGSATSIPVIDYDAQGHIKKVGSVTVYPPTTKGSSGQFLSSDGSQVIWKTMDSAPASNSGNAVTSGGVYNALADKQPVLKVGTNLDDSPVSNSTNPITSGAVKAAVDGLNEAIANAAIKLTGAVTSITVNNLTASKVLVSDADGKVAVSTLDSSKLTYLSDVTSNIQTQINGKLSTIPAAGSATRPIYIAADGTPTAGNYTLGAACVKGVATQLTESTDLVTAGTVKTAVDGINASVNTLNTTVSNLSTAVDGKMDEVEIESTPTSGSEKLVTSGGVFSAINTLQTAVDGKQKTITVSSDEPTASDGADGDIWAVLE